MRRRCFQLDRGLAVVFAAALACRASSPSAPSGPSGPSAISRGPAASRPPVPAAGAHRDFPPFPPSDTPPGTAEVAALLASGLPAADRAAATRLLIDDILSRDLRDLPGDPGAKPSARAIVRAAYDTLAGQLDPLAPEQRLSRLATIACHRRGDRVTRRATALAVARYVAERGRPRSNLVAGYLEEARPYLAMTAAALLSEADRVDRDLTTYERDAQGEPACLAQQAPLLAHARHALGAARSGRFDPAAGAFYVFLRHAGEAPQRASP